ncbi:MAG: autotransporter adhesin family protein [Phycisphaerales bacterium]|nr:autotransporter adhesin family protein [Phycisphaerales bacterium]
MQSFSNAAVAAGAVLCAGTALAGMQNIDYRVVGTNLVDTGGFNWTIDVIAVLDAGSRLDAVAGNTVNQKIVASSGGFYQNSFCGPTSLENNEGFWALQPSMEFDSFVTIGSLSNVNNALQNIGIDFTDFENGGDISADNGTWFVIPTEPQGEPITIENVECTDVNSVIFARLTVLGEDSGVNIAALFQGRDDMGASWQHSDDLFITYDELLDGDCDGNGIADRCDFAAGGDANGNGILDACEFTDCNNNGTNDADDIADGTSEDCDGNSVPDECDLADGAADCDGDGIMDVCELGEDCNGNGVPDSCDIADGSEEDCDGNGRPDTCDIADGGDANGNGELDACEITPYRNLNSGLISDTAAEAVFAADNGDTIEAEADYFNAETDVNFMGKSLYMNVVEGGMAQGGTMTLANGAVVTGTGGSFVNNVISGFSGTGVVADDDALAVSGLTLVRSGAGIEYVSADINLTGATLVMSGGSLAGMGTMTNGGSMTMVGDAVCVAGSLANSGYMSTSGTFVTDLTNGAAGEVYCNDETMLSGSLVNDGLVSVNRGPLYVLGSLTNNGTIIGDVDTGPLAGGDEPAVGDGLRIGGDYIAGAGAELIMAHPNWQLAIGGNFDVAIDHHDRYVMDEATIAMTGIASTQSIEAMSVDVDSSTDGIDRTIDGHFPIGQLVIESGSTVNVVDNYDNADGEETIYVKHLVIEAGATLNTGTRTLWYETVENLGTVIGEIDVIKDPCPGDSDGNGVVNIDDLLTVIGNFACQGECDGDVDDNGSVDIDDLLMVIGNFGACE